MKALLLCDMNAQEACAKEASTFGVGILEKKTTYVLVEGTQKQIATLAWQGQTLLDIAMVLTQECSISDCKKEQWDQNALDILKKAHTFAVKSYNEERNEENGELGATLKAIIQKEVQLDTPDILFIYYENILAISLANKELHKRNYRIFTSNTSLRSTIAAAALILSGYSGKEELLLPYETDGTLAIEAAYMALEQSPQHYDGLGMQRFWETTPTKKEEIKGSIQVMTQSVQFLKAIQKNAKIAGVHKKISVTKADLDWMDTKFEEKSTDIIFAYLPSSGKHRSAQEAGKIADELAYQCKDLLKKKGTLAILTLKPKEHIPHFEKHTFIKKEEHTLCMGKQELCLILFTR